MSKYCPHCDQTYEGIEADTCPEDGARLYVESDRPEDPLLGTVLEDRFRIEQRLSEGGMGAVYRATQLSVSRTVALKVVRPGMEDKGRFLERFFREARIIAELSHPNIVQLIDFGQDHDREDIIYLVMELVRGTELGELLAQSRLDAAMALEVVYQICGGLTEAHTSGVVHRDLKPANIILAPSSDETFQVKIVDFGIARPDDTGTELTKTGMICGTPAYLSPEQAEHQPVDERADLYSLGVVLFEMLTGHPPFRGPSGLQLLMEHVARKPPRLADAYPGVVPEPISRLVSDLLEKNPEDRPGSARQVRRRIRQIRDQLQLEPVLLQEDHGESAEIEQLFSPWVLEALEPEPLEEADSKAGSDPARLADDGPVPRGEPAPPDQRADAGDDEPPTVPSRKEASRRRGLQSPVVMAAAVLAAVVLSGIVFFAVMSEDTADPEDESDDRAVAHQAVDESSGSGAEPPEDDTISDQHTGERDQVQPGEPGDEPPAQPRQPSPEAPDEQLPVEQDPGQQAPSVETGDQLAEAAGDASGDPVDPGAAQAPQPHADPSRDHPGEEVYEGSVVIENSEELSAAQQHTRITGDLMIRLNVDGHSRIELPELERIGGSLVVDPISRVSTVSLPELQRVDGRLTLSGVDDLETLDAPGLEVIGDDLQLSSTQLETFELEELYWVGGMVFVSQNDLLSELELPALEEVGEAFSVMENSELATLEMPRLSEVGDTLQVLSGAVQTVSFERLNSVGAGVMFNENDELQRLELGSLTSVGFSSDDQMGFALNEAGALEQLDLSQLSRVHGSMTINSLSELSDLNLERLEEVEAGLTLSENSAVEAIDLGGLTTVGDNLLISGHSALEELSLSQLEQVGDLMVMNSPQLSSCELQQHTDAMAADGWEGDARLVGLDDDGCSEG